MLETFCHAFLESSGSSTMLMEVTPQQTPAGVTMSTGVNRSCNEIDKLCPGSAAPAVIDLTGGGQFDNENCGPSDSSKCAPSLVHLTTGVLHDGNVLAERYQRVTFFGNGCMMEMSFLQKG